VNLSLTKPATHKTVTPWLFDWAGASLWLAQTLCYLGSGAMSGTPYICPNMDITYACFWTWPKTDIRSSTNKHKPSMIIHMLEVTHPLLQGANRVLGLVKR